MKAQTNQATRMNRTIPAPTSRRPRGRRLKLNRVLQFLSLIFLSIVFGTPLYWALISSLKTSRELHIVPPRWLPEVAQWGNYTKVLTAVPFFSWVANSVIILALSLLGTMIASSLVAYGFARFEFPGKNVLFLLALSTMMVPAQVTLIPQYLLFNEMKWIDTFLPLIVPSWFAVGAFNVFLLRQFFLSLPIDLDEAAEIDGASTFKIFWKILLPLSRPALATVAVINFIAVWSDFLRPLIFLHDINKLTVSVGLRFFSTFEPDMTDPRDHLIMACSMLVALPCIVTFFATQRFFVRGVVMSGIKG